MGYKFKKRDIGKRVSLIIDLEKVEGKFYNEKKRYMKIPYDAIDRINFLIKTEDSKMAGILNTSKTSERKINPLLVAKELGAGKMNALGDIEEITKDYIGIREYRTSVSFRLH
jgi:hypothetical protein